MSIQGTYLEIIPNRKVVFTWGGVEGLEPGQSTVEFVLEPDGGAHWCSCAITDRQGLIAAAGSIPELVKLKDKGGRRPRCV